MKARQPKLKLDQLAIDTTDVKDFILNDCANYAEAAEFFGVDKATVGRWMMGTVRPHPSCTTAVAAYRKLMEVAA